MRKKLLFPVAVLFISIIGAFNMNIVQNENDGIHLQNVEVLLYGGSGGYNCALRGSLDCPSKRCKSVCLLVKNHL